jgi:hypothetical protein
LETEEDTERQSEQTNCKSFKRYPESGLKI